MTISLGAPDVMAGAHLALVIDKAAFEHKGLLDFNVLVQCQLDSRPPAKKRGQEAAFRILQQDLHVDARTRGWLPRQALDLDITRSQRTERFRPLEKGSGSRHRRLLR